MVGRGLPLDCGCDDSQVDSGDDLTLGILHIAVCEGRVTGLTHSQDPHTLPRHQGPGDREQSRLWAAWHQANLLIVNIHSLLVSPLSACDSRLPPLIQLYREDLLHRL